MFYRFLLINLQTVISDIVTNCLFCSQFLKEIDNSCFGLFNDGLNTGLNRFS